MRLPALRPGPSRPEHETPLTTRSLRPRAFAEVGAESGHQQYPAQGVYLFVRVLPGGAHREDLGRASRLLAARDDRRGGADTGRRLPGELEWEAPVSGAIRID